MPTEGRNLLSLPREKKYYVYMMASKSRVLYVGVTGSLMSRVQQHKAGEIHSSNPTWEDLAADWGQRIPIEKAGSSLWSE
jgi:GIY-YIG catalytic domain